MESHVHCLGALRLYFVGDDTNGRCDVVLDGGRWLRVAHLLEGNAHWHSFARGNTAGHAEQSRRIKTAIEAPLPNYGGQEGAGIAASQRVWVVPFRGCLSTEQRYFHSNVNPTNH